MHKVSMGVGLSVSLPRGGLPFERHSALWIHSLGNAHRAAR